MKPSPRIGDTLLFVKSQLGQSDQQMGYQAVGFPSYYLERRALIDIQSASSTLPACIMGTASRITSMNDESGRG